ncbi:SDR family NAD(P)-dependent oxidoreductase [Coraliomargarita parva]|uniref:SDR family NAD(P)-dependent oxidoreductase n=1 Tax=Coraliomargarita parva TaxID=3014050 RepID=UPI0022B45229|nr:SDR family oxidoreductase [Coraliomargarita parva]
MELQQFSLKGKTALVTGSSRGIGRSILLGLARLGANVVVHGVRAGEAAESVLAEAKALGVEAQFVAGDLSAPQGGKACAEAVLAAVRQVDIVVLNASIQVKKAWLEQTPEDIEGQLRTNFIASLEMLQVLVPPMKENGWGRILTVGSVQQKKPHPMMLPYAASKCAQESMVRSLAVDLAPHGITVNNLAPGVILTDRNTDALADPDYLELVKSKIPAGYCGESDDCAGVAQLLCSDAGRYITGQDIYADGGMSL